jgi:hypothetical protein
MASLLHTTSLIPGDKKSIRPCPPTFLVAIQQGQYPKFTIQNIGTPPSGTETTQKHFTSHFPSQYRQLLHEFEVRMKTRRTPLTRSITVQSNQNPGSISSSRINRSKLTPHRPRSRAPPQAGSSHHPPIHETSTQTAAAGHPRRREPKKKKNPAD